VPLHVIAFSSGMVKTAVFLCNPCICKHHRRTFTPLLPGDELHVAEPVMDTEDQFNRHCHIIQFFSLPSV